MRLVECNEVLIRNVSKTLAGFILLYFFHKNVEGLSRNELNGFWTGDGKWVVHLWNVLHWFLS